MRTIPIAAVSLAMSVAGIDAASAHAFLRAATPAPGSVVGSAPHAVVIRFTEGVEPLFSTIVVTDAGGASVDLGHPHLAGGDDRLAVALRPLPPGTYTVVWHATATDTHRTQGRFSFRVR